MTAVLETPALADRLDRFQRMLRIRYFEDHAAILYRDGKIPGFVHLSSGQEAVAVGVCSALQPGDVITSTHRGHGHALAKGADLQGMLAELLGRATGTCGGYGGSMHIADPDLGIFGANGIVGAGVPIAAGAALAMKLRNDGQIAVSFFGDGAVATGAFYEATNLASVLQLPLLLVCEDNGYSEFSAATDQHPVPVEQRALAFGISAQVVDGNDVEAVLAAATAVAAQVRSSGQPALLVARTLRRRGHYEGDQQRYRSADLDAAFADPLDVVRQSMIIEGMTQQDLDEIAETVAREVERCVDAALQAPWPSPDDLATKALAGTYPQPNAEDYLGDGEESRVSRLIRKALDDALADDDRVFLAGIDVGRGGNVFGLTRELYDRYPGRIIDTPISETAIVGAAVGSAMAGLRPVVELMYLDFLGVCLDQLLNQAAKLRFMTGGRASVGLTLRTQFAVGRSSAAQHSQSLEAILAHIPGLVVVMPSSPEDHYGLLRSAIESPDPVIVIENRLLYEKAATVPPPTFRTPLGKARVAREGRDVTVVSASQGVWTALEAAELAAAEGIDVEVIDLRTITPWDRETVLASLAKTTRIIVYSQGVRDFGITAEILAEAAELGFWNLDAPPIRIAGLATPVPYSPPLEAKWLPSAEDLLNQIRVTCADR